MGEEVIKLELPLVATYFRLQIVECKTPYPNLVSVVEVGCNKMETLRHYAKSKPSLCTLSLAVLPLLSLCSFPCAPGGMKRNLTGGNVGVQRSGSEFGCLWSLCVGAGKA